LKKILALIFVFGLLFSCSEEKEFLIPEDKMVDVLVDIHIADGVLNTNSFPYEDERLRAENYYRNILDDHEISRQDFDSALSQYAQNREIYIEMYDKVIEKLRTKESFVQAASDSTKVNNNTSTKFYHHFSTDYENGLTISSDKAKNITNVLSSSGKHSYHVLNEEYSQGYSANITQPITEVEYKFNAKVLFKEIPEIFPSVAFIIEKDGKILSKYHYSLEKANIKLLSWTPINVKTNLVLPNPEKDIVIRTYFFNRSKPEYFVDDFTLEIKQLK
jgi:hypothetical protein